MTAISSKEFVANQKKYFDMAVNKNVLIKRGRNKFIISNANVNDEFLEPDDDLRRAITKDELLKGIYEDIDNFFASK